MKTIEQILEDNEFNVTPIEGGSMFCYEINRYTPAGEDWHFYVSSLTEIVEYAENFDPDDEMEMWCEAKHCGTKHMRESIPGYGELWKEQLWKQKILKRVANRIRRTKEWQNIENA